MSWAEEQDWFGLEEMVLMFPDPQDEIKNGYWVQADLEAIALTAMTDRHLSNCIKMIEEGRLRRKWALPYLKQEQERRKHDCI